MAEETSAQELSATGDGRLYCHELQLSAPSLDSRSTVSGTLGKLPLSANATRGVGARRKWETRFVAVCANVLYIFRNSTSKKPSAALLLDQAKAEAADDHKEGAGREFLFVLTTRAGRAFLLACASEARREEWLSTILASSFPEAERCGAEARAALEEQTERADYDLKAAAQRARPLL